MRLATRNADLQQHRKHNHIDQHQRTHERTIDDDKAQETCVPIGADQGFANRSFRLWMV